MPETSILQSTILLNSSEGFTEALHHVAQLTSHPQLTASMFTSGDSRAALQAIAFATTYNDMDIWSEAWPEFLLRFEYILIKSDFNFARLTLETSSIGSTHLLWTRKSNEAEVDESLIECPHWYFGTGMRNMHGELDPLYPVAPVLQFEYPLAFDDDTKEQFNMALPGLNSATLHEPLFLDQTSLKDVAVDPLRFILTYLQLQSVITWGIEKDRLFITRLRDIKPLTMPYDGYDIV